MRLTIFQDKSYNDDEEDFDEYSNEKGTMMDGINKAYGVYKKRILKEFGEKNESDSD